MRIKFKQNIQNSGFSTLEVLIAVPIVALVAMFYMNLSESLQQSKKMVMNAQQALSLKRQMQINLSVGSNCTETFNGINLNNFSDIKRNGGAQDIADLGLGIKPGATLFAGSMAVKSISLYGSNLNGDAGLMDIGDFPGESIQGVVEVRVQYLKQKLTSYEQVIHFPVIFTIDSSGNITDCTSNVTNIVQTQSLCHQLGGVVKAGLCQFYTFSGCDLNDMACLQATLQNPTSLGSLQPISTILQNL